MDHVTAYWLLIGVLILATACAVAVWAGGRISRDMLGNSTTALPAGTNTILDQLVRPLLDAHTQPESAAVLLSDPVVAFGARLHTARIAQRSLDIQYYGWHHDATGQLLERELLNAADRGVRVRLLFDDMGTRGSDPWLLAMNAHPNVHVRLFNPTRYRGLLRILESALHFARVNRRMHNKAWTADNRVAIVGGRNIGDEYFGAASDTTFRDTDLLLIGPAVAATSTIFDDFWNAHVTVPIHALYRRSCQTALPAADEGSARHTEIGKFTARTQAITARNEFIDRLATGTIQMHWSPSIRVLSDPPEKALTTNSARDRAGWLLYDISSLLYSARRESLMISPYFVPGANGALLLTGQVRRGMRVCVLTNSLAANDVSLTHAGYYKYRKRLLTHGVQLYELRPERRGMRHRLTGSRSASLHSKAFVIDKTRGFVGSFNLDQRSARLNTEMGVVFDEPALAAELTEFFRTGTRPRTAWEVIVAANGKLRWHGYGGELWKHDPETNFGLRLVVRLLTFLPIESQL